jgi:hypothetical protein
MLKHIEFLDKKIKNLLESSQTSMPYIFEYYSAIKLSKQFNKEFYVYNDVFKFRKQHFNFPLTVS